MASATVTFVPSSNYDQSLARAAGAYGVESEYWDIFGKRHIATPEIQRAILRSLGVTADTQEELDQALEDQLWRDWSCLLPPVCVISQNRAPLEVEVSVHDEEERGTLEAELRWETGGIQRFSASLAQLRTSAHADLREQRFVRKRIPLPDSLRLGYHDLKLRVVSAAGSREAHMRLIVTPDRAYDPPALADGGKTAGVFFPLYAIRSARNWGCGDFTDLKGAIDWVASDVGGGFVGLNPLHIIANRQPYNTSPYLPTSVYFRNPLYLDVERVAGFDRSGMAQRLLARPEVQSRLARLRDSEFVEYEQVWRLKLVFLSLAFREFWKLYTRQQPGNEEGAAFDRYVAEQGDLLDQFATHQALDQHLHRCDKNVWNWPAWPHPYQDCSTPETAEFRRRYPRLLAFHKYLQWQVDTQLAEAHAYAQSQGLPLGLYHDLALATDRFGADVWMHPGFYVTGCRVGAPPDDFSPNGQDWSFPPPDTARHHTDAYRLFAESIRRNCRHGGALRIDHVMRFFRLFWIPDGSSAKDGTYVVDHHEEWLRVLALESVRNQVIVVGEDLGTVEPEFREILERFGIRSYRLFYFERDDARNFRGLAEYPRQALVSATTHDLPSLAGFWTGRDIDARLAAGLVDQASCQRQRAEREGDKQKMLEALHAAGLLPSWFPRRAADVPEFTGELHNAVTGFLASTPCELLVINQEDIWKAPDQQNLPGSTAEYPNWRRKTAYSLEDLRTDRLVRDCTHMISDWLRRSGRSPSRPSGE